MTMLRSIKVVAWFACQVLAGAAAGANAQAPESKGPVVKPLLNLDLAPEMDAVQAARCACRLPSTSLAPPTSRIATRTGPRSPTSCRERSSSTAARSLSPGDAFTADRNTTHWMENKGAVPAVMLVNGIAKKE
jgi:hypothetical protein